MIFQIGNNFNSEVIGYLYTDINHTLTTATSIIIICCHLLIFITYHSFMHLFFIIYGILTMTQTLFDMLGKQKRTK
jgi:hypothetical protein